MAAAVAAALAAAGGQGQRLLRGCVSAKVRPPRFSGAQGLVVWARFRFQFRVWARQGWGAWGWRRSLFDAVGCTIVDACQVCRRSVQMGAHVAEVGAPAPEVEAAVLSGSEAAGDAMEGRCRLAAPVDMHLACRRLQFVDQEWVLCEEGPSPPQPADVPFPRFL